MVSRVVIDKIKIVLLSKKVEGAGKWLELHLSNMAFVPPRCLFPEHQPHVQDSVPEMMIRFQLPFLEHRFEDQAHLDQVLSWLGITDIAAW